MTVAVLDWEGEAQPLLDVSGLHYAYGAVKACRDISFDLWPGEVLGIVGESGSGKSTLLKCLDGLLTPDAGHIYFSSPTEGRIDLTDIDEPLRRRLMRTELGIVHQNPRDGLMMNVSAGGNIGERMIANGSRHVGAIRHTAQSWMQRVELDQRRIDDRPHTYSGGMQQRLQIARVMVSKPSLLLMDEPTGGLDVSVQARLLDTLQNVVRMSHVSAIIVTHDIAVARMITDRLMVMKDGEIVEAGLTDQLLDDPHHAYTQLLVSAVLRP